MIMFTKKNSCSILFSQAFLKYYENKLKLYFSSKWCLIVNSKINFKIKKINKILELQGESYPIKLHLSSFIERK